MKIHGKYIADTNAFMKVAGVSYEQAEDLILTSRLNLVDGTEEEWPVPPTHQFVIYEIKNKLAFAISNDGDWLRIYVGHVANVHGWLVDEEITTLLKNEMDS